MNAKEFYKDLFGVEPKENSTTINQSVLTFAERYAKHYASETLAELERHKKLHQGMLDALTQAEKELENLKQTTKNYLRAVHNDNQQILELLKPLLK